MGQTKQKLLQSTKLCCLTEVLCLSRVVQTSGRQELRGSKPWRWRMTSCQTDRSSCHRRGPSAADWPNGTVSTSVVNSDTTCGMSYHSRTCIHTVKHNNYEEYAYFYPSLTSQVATVKDYSRHHWTLLPLREINLKARALVYMSYSARHSQSWTEPVPLTCSSPALVKPLNKLL